MESKRFLSEISAAAPAAAERRQYGRLRSIVPVEVDVKDAQAGTWALEGLQGFTQDVGAGGLCVELLRLSADELRALQQASVHARVAVHLPPFRAPVMATAHVAWIEARTDAGGRGYRIGLAFDVIAVSDRQRLVSYAQRTRWIPRAVAMAAAMLLVAIGNLSWQAHAGAGARRLLVAQLQHFTQRETSLRQQLRQVDGQRGTLQQQLLEAQRAVERLNAERVAAAATVLATVALPVPSPAVMPPTAPESTTPTVAAAQAALTALGDQDAAIQRELRSIATAKAAAETELLHNLYSWLRAHQYPATGLLISYEGDSALDDWAFTYDQSLMVPCFLLFGDTQAAKQILTFFARRAQRVDGGFVNAYDAVSGTVREYAVHVGPNVWLGMAAMHYTQATGDRQFLPLAQQIAAWVEQLQQQDAEGGIRGGPRETWYSTEHNLDAYALFMMLADVTGERKYRDDAARVQGWLKQHAHGRLPGQINRGRGDATIATDTFAWAIAALGPSTLQAMGLDPDQIMAFAQEHCAVRTTVGRPDQPRLAVDGFDFSKPRHLARGGIISTEWTGQMIVAMKLMAADHERAGRVEQAAQYRQQAAHYETESAKLIVHAPCPMGHAGWALPYASQGNVDTGHGWRTAQGATTGSTSGTVYHIFARLGFNPLQLTGYDRGPAHAHASDAP